MDLRLELATILIDQIKKNPSGVYESMLKSIINRKYIDHDHIHGIIAASDLLQNQINSLEGKNGNELYSCLQKRIDGIISSLHILSEELCHCSDFKQEIFEPIGLFREKYNQLVLSNIPVK